MTESPTLRRERIIETLAALDRGDWGLPVS